MKKSFLLLFFILLFSSIALANQQVKTNYASELILTRGVLVQGSVFSTHVYNSNFMSIQEVTGNNGILFSLKFTGVTGDVLNLSINARYMGGASHDVVMEIFDYSSNTWVLLKTYTNSPAFQFDAFDISYITCCNNNEILLRFNHADSGVTSHYMDIDYLVITSTGVVTHSEYFMEGREMGFVDWFFLLQFFIVIALFLVKLFNVFKLGEWLSIEMVWLVFIVFWLFYGAGFVLLLNNPMSPTLWSLFTIQSWLSRLFFVLFFVEFFFIWKNKYAPKDIKPYNPMDNK